MPAITIKGRMIKGLKAFYAQGGPSEPCALISSDDMLEIFCHQKNVNAMIGTADDEPLIIL